MTNAKNCLVCGKQFVPCNTCLKNVPEEMQWKKVVCCEEHFAYHLPVILYVRNKINKETAKADLTNAINKYGKIQFTDNIESIVNEILSEDIIAELKEPVSVSLDKTDFVVTKTANKKNKKNN